VGEDVEFCESVNPALRRGDKCENANRQGRGKWQWKGARVATWRDMAQIGVEKGTFLLIFAGHDGAFLSLSFLPLDLRFIC
jgi:hypothetical protein